MEDKLNAPVVNTIPGFRVLPGVVSKEWIERRNQLQDKIDELQVKIYELDLKISNGK